MSKHSQYLDKYHQYVSTTNNWNDNVIDYLQGDNKNLYGTILGLKKGWKNNQVVSPDFYAFLLFFDHSTGRIERYLINKGVKQEIEFDIINEVIDPINHQDIIDSENNKRIRPIYSTPYNIPKHLNFHILSDGKLNKVFYRVFLFELFRDYFYSHKSYKIPNMDIIRTWTDPTDFNEQDPNKVARGSGEVIIRKDWQILIYTIHLLIHTLNLLLPHILSNLIVIKLKKSIYLKTSIVKQKLILTKFMVIIWKFIIKIMHLRLFRILKQFSVLEIIIVLVNWIFLSKNLTIF